MKMGTVVTPALLLAAGIALGGWFVGHGFQAGRGADRYVTVKGLAEREAKADLALWPLRVVATSNRLEEAQGKIKADLAAVRAFLASAGVEPGEVELQSLDVTDRFAQSWSQGGIDSRFIISQTLMVRSGEVDRIAAASQRIGELVEGGVVLSAEGYMGGTPTYLFTRLNEVKPEMIAEATRNAREAAGQFARDSGSRIGGIRTASQGLFQILARDNAPGMPEEKQIRKTVRVVSTVEYLLED